MGSAIIPPGNAPELLCRGRAGTGRSCSIETCGDFVSPIPGFGGIRSFPAKPQDGGAECGIWENTEALPGVGDSSDPGKIQGIPSGALKKRNFGVGEPPALRGPGICDVTIAPTATSLQSFGDGLELFGGNLGTGWSIPESLGSSSVLPSAGILGTGRVCRANSWLMCPHPCLEPLLREFLPRSLPGTAPPAPCGTPQPPELFSVLPGAVPGCF